MRTLFSIVILIIQLNQFVYSQLCSNFDFENCSYITVPPATLNISNPLGITGWTVNSGTVANFNNICNLSGCCSTSPISTSVLSTNTLTGNVDPIIGSSYAIYSVYGDSLNTGGFILGNPFSSRGKWLLKLNDAIPNSGVHVLSKQYNITILNSYFVYAILPVFSSTPGFYQNCNKPSVRIRLWDMTTSTLVNSCDLSITTSSIITGNLCKANPSNFLSASTAGFQFSKWITGAFELYPYIGKTVKIEVIVADCVFGDHSGYAYFDSQCISESGTLWCHYSTPTPYVFSTCGSTNIPVYAATGLGPYLWSGPIGWPGNGATTHSVNLTIPGVYTITMSPPGVCTPITKTFTLINTPAVINASLSLSQNTVCTGGNSITLSGAPLGGNFYGTNVSGNIFNPSSSGNYTLNYVYTDANGCSDTAYSSISVINCSTNISQLNNDNQLLNVFPIPFNNILQIETSFTSFENLQIEITNLLGEKIKILQLKQSKQSLNLEDFESGIYHVCLKNEGTIIKTKVIIKN